MKTQKSTKLEKVVFWHHYQWSERTNASPGNPGSTAGRLQPQISGLTCDNMIFYSTNAPLSPLYGLQIPIFLNLNMMYTTYWKTIKELLGH